MGSVPQIIKNHSNYVSRKKPKLATSCNCRKKDDCPLNGNCLTNNVIYKCTASPTTTTKQRAYLGLTKGELKQCIITIHSLLETKDIRKIQHFLVNYGN